MADKFFPQILQQSHADEILDFERTLLRKNFSEEESQLREWRAPWRRESLEHYLPLGWSFGLRDADENLIGYFLAQPLLFFANKTQSLWVEHLTAQESTAVPELVTLARNLSREKHLQNLLLARLDFENESDFPEVEVVPTTKYRSP